MATFRQRGKYTYQLRASLGKGSNNRYIYKYKTYKVDKKMTPKQLEEHLQNEAYKFEQEALSQKHFTNSQYTFKDFVEYWKSHWLEKEVGESTIILKLSYLNNHILPVLSHFKLHDISSMMLLDLLSNLTRKDNQKGKLSVSAKHEVHKVLMNIFKSAVNWGVIKVNPMLGIDPPKQTVNTKSNLNVFDENEVQTLLSALQSESEHWRIFITLSLATGMRRSELTALEWKHIDLKNHTINIQQIISKTRNGIKIKEPKYDSKRIVSIPISVVETLKQYKLFSRHEQKQLQLNFTKQKHDWVFYNSQGGHLHPDTPTKWWKRFLERKKIRHIRLHDLRHTAATLLIGKNVHAKIISERLGHKNITTTMNIYGHALPSIDRKASEKINDVFK